jgi:hypothetical protein
MKLNFTLLLITLFSGLAIFAIGLYLQLAHQSSEGLVAGRLGNINHGTMTGFSGLFIGSALLILSIWIYRNYKKEKKRFDQMD